MKRLQPYLVPLSALLLFIPLITRYLKGNPLIPAGGFADPVILVSVALGVLSAYLFSRLAPKLTKSPRLQALLILLFIVNPVFLTLFTSVDPLVAAVPLAFLLLLTQRRSTIVLGSLLLAFLHPLFAILFLAVTWKRTFLPATLLAAALIVIRSTSFHYPAIHFVEFGYIHGMSLLLVTLALIECVRRWPERKPLIPFLALLAFTPFTDAAIVLVGLASAPLAAVLIDALERRRWKIKEAKPLTLLLIGCGLLFLFLTHTAMLINAEPTKDTADLLRLLPEGSVVLTPAEFAPAIERFSRATPLIITEDTQPLFMMRKQAEADTIMLRYDITHLIITQDMRAQWNHDEDGLLFLLKHSEHFERLGGTSTMEVWRFEKLY